MIAEDLRPESIARTAFFTGHRSLPSNELTNISALVFQCITDAYILGYRRFFCGGALGFDTLAAFETIRFREFHSDVVLSLAIPCETQSDLWTENDKELYRQILMNANEKTILSPYYYRGAMLSRNRYMADRSSLCICYMTHWKSGTASAVRYAMAQERFRIINLAVERECEHRLLREEQWNYTFISPSAKRNADIAPLRLLSGRKLSLRNI